MDKGIVFFDLGNTLTPSRPVSARRQFGQRLRLPEKDVKRVGRLIMTWPAGDPQTLAGKLRSLLKDRDPEQILEAVQVLWNQEVEELSLLPEVFEVLDRLQGMSYRLGLLSNLWQPTFEGLLKNAPGIIQRFDHLIFSYRVGFKKPSLSLFQEAIRTAGFPPHRCWMVGDSYELDMEPAMKLGMRTVWVLSRPEAERGLLAEILSGYKPPPDRAVGSLRDVPHVMELLN